VDYIELDLKVQPREPGSDILCVALCDIGFDSFVDTEEGVLAYIPAAQFSEEGIHQILLQYKDEFKTDFTFKELKGENWNQEWEKNFSPVIINEQCIIRAPFHEPFLNVKYEIVIEPKMSFGTGHHETTALMADFMINKSFNGIADKSVLDMGCGTGVLAILAAMIGAREITAIDNDEWAFSNTCENILVNNYNSIKAELGDAKLLQDRKFDTILANINRNILLNDMPAYAEALLPGGDLLMSGFYNTDIEILKNKAVSLGLKPVGEKSLHNWSILHLIKN
jgi:ribosomal protein L11 methyltransferase